MAEPQVDKGSSATLTVACKLPHGLQMRVFKMIPHTEPVNGGGVRESKIAEQEGDVVLVKGYAAPTNMRPTVPVIGSDTGFALTHGISRKFFERWLDENKDHPAVVNGLIFAADGDRNVAAKAREGEKLKNGLEPLDPNNLPKLSRNLKVKKFDPKDEAA